MKSLTSLSKRFRVSLALLTALATLPLGSAFQNAEAKPKSSAPAYGYRAKDTRVKKAKKQKRNMRRDVRRDRDDDRDGRWNDRNTSRRNDRNTARPNRRNERFDDRRNSDAARARINSTGKRVRDLVRSGR